MPKISIIVAVYGAEKYIERCVRSLFEQTLDDIEYIFIDDCSPDHSIEILNRVLVEYPYRREQVKIHLMARNCGPIARFYGLNLATGDYVIYCDSDDWVDKDTCQVCYSKAETDSLDVVFFDFDVTNGIVHKIIKRQPAIQNKKILLSQLISGRLMGSLCGALVRRSIYLENPLIYPQYNMNEDLALLIQLIHYARSYGYISRPFYHYFKSPESITARGTKEKAVINYNASVANFELLHPFFESNGYFQDYRQEFACMKFRRMNTLALYAQEVDVRDLWRKAFHELGYRSFFNPFIPVNDKLICLMTLTNIYKLVYDYRHK